jgi:hypothetical protein
MLDADYGVNMARYDEPFFQIIDSLIYLHFGKEASELIMFYLYERVNPDGTINDILDENNNPVPLTSVEDLWELIKQLKK